MFIDAKIIGKNVSTGQYLAQKRQKGVDGYVLSRSDMTKIRECPHKWMFGEESKETKSTSWGSLVDRLVLGGDEDIVVTPDTYESSDGKSKPWNWNANTCKRWLEENIGKVVCDNYAYNQAQTAALLIKNDSHLKALLDNASFQVMVAAMWDAGAVKIPVKTLIDILPAKMPVLADLKTSASIEPRDYGRSIHKFGYHVQAALYLDVWNAAMPNDKRNTFVHVAQESCQPYEVGRRLLSEEWIQMGRAEYKAALEIYAQCVISGEWASYDDLESPNLQRIEGWSVSSPEPWMILSSGVIVDNKPDWMSE